MSNRLADAHHRLEEWGRWARSGDPEPLGLDGAPIYLPAFDLYSPYGDRDDGWGDPVPPDPPAPPVDELRADKTDKLIRYAIHWRHRKIIQLHYHKLRRQDEEYVNAAVRAIADALAPVLRRVA